MLKRLTFAWAAVLLVWGAVFSPAFGGVTVTVDDIIQLHQEGLSAEVIKAFITSSGQKFELDVDEILRLKKAGVPDEIIELMIKTGKPEEEPAPPPQTTTGPDGEVEPGFDYRKRYHSVFSLQVFKKRVMRAERVLAVGKRDPLRNTAKRSGTLFLTDAEVVMFDMDGDERFRLKYADIIKIKIEIRYKNEIEARFHPLDTRVLWIIFKRDGQEFFVKVYTLPQPEKNLSTYGSVTDIAKAIQGLG